VPCYRKAVAAIRYKRRGSYEDREAAACLDTTGVLGRVAGMFTVASGRALLWLWMPRGDGAWGSENGREHAGSGAGSSGKCAGAGFLYFRFSRAEQEF